MASCCCCATCANTDTCATGYVCICAPTACAQSGMQPLCWSATCVGGGTCFTATCAGPGNCKYDPPQRGGYVLTRGCCDYWSEVCGDRIVELYSDVSTCKPAYAPPVHSCDACGNNPACNCWWLTITPLVNGVPDFTCQAVFSNQASSFTCCDCVNLVANVLNRDSVSKCAQPTSIQVATCANCPCCAITCCCPNNPLPQILKVTLSGLDNITVTLTYNAATCFWTGTFASNCGQTLTAEFVCRDANNNASPCLGNVQPCSFAFLLVCTADNSPVNSFQAGTQQCTSPYMSNADSLLGAPPGGACVGCYAKPKGTWHVVSVTAA